MFSSLDERVKLTRTAMKIYMYLVKCGRVVGVREIARSLGLPPSTVYYHLKRLEELELIQRNGDGYKIKEIVNPEEFVILGKMFIPRLIVYSFFFLGISMGLIIVMVINGIDVDKALALTISSLAFLLLFIEGLNYVKKYQE